MPSKTKKMLHTCQCGSCAQHPYSRIAKEHKAINRVLLGLDERNKRRFVGVLVNQQGNILQLSQIAGLSRNTIYRGQNEVEHPSRNPASGIRQSGAGRLHVEKKQPGILNALEKILKDATAGDPIAGLKWTGFEIGHSAISRLARGLGYALRGNRKGLSRKQDAGRDHQMRYLTRLRNRLIRQKMPVISVDCKKKEIIGLFCKPERTLRRIALEVLSTDFPSEAKGKAIPYGIYDVRH